MLSPTTSCISVNVLDFSPEHELGTVNYNLDYSPTQDPMKGLGVAYYEEEYDKLYKLIPTSKGIALSVAFFFGENTLFILFDIFDDDGMSYVLADFIKYVDFRIYSVVIMNNSKAILNVYNLVQNKYILSYSTDQNFFSAIYLEDNGYFYYFENLANINSTFWKVPVRSMTALENFELDIPITSKEETPFEVFDLGELSEADGIEINTTDDHQIVDYILNVTQGYVLPVIFHLEPVHFRSLNTNQFNINEFFVHTNYPEDLEIVHTLQPLEGHVFPEGMKLNLDSKGIPKSFTKIPFVTDGKETFGFMLQTQVGGIRKFYKPITITVYQCLQD